MKMLTPNSWIAELDLIRTSHECIVRSFRSRWVVKLCRRHGPAVRFEWSDA